MIFGVDVSNHQSHFDFGAARAEGYDFAFVKSTQGDYFTDARYGQHVSNAQGAGLLVAAYHYQWNQSAYTQAQHIRNVVGTDIPVILDVEEGSGSIDITRDLVRLLTGYGYRVPLVYIPRWYWSGHLGSPDLSGLPPLWISRYPDYTVRDKAGALSAALQLTGGNLFVGHGGLSAPVAQITSSGAVADYPNGSIDLNVFVGSRDQLAALLGDDPTESGNGSMDRIVKASNGNAVYLVRLDPKGPGFRHLTGEEAALFPDAVTVTPDALAAFLEKAKGTVTDAALVWNYAIPDGTAFTPAHLLPDRILNQGAGLVGNQEALLAAFWELQTSLLKAIREIPAGPSGDVDYARIEGIIRKVFGDAAAGPLDVTS